MDELLSLAEFRRRRDWYGLRDVADRLPLLKAQFAAARQQRARLKREITRYLARKERVPQHLEDEYTAAAWEWQHAYGAYTLARKTYAELVAQHPQWGQELAVREEMAG